MLLNQLFEAITRTGKGDTAVVGWGRGMGHKGHMMLASSVITKAKEVGGDPYFVVSRTVGKDDPITPEEKLAIYKKVFPQQGHIFQAASDEIPDLTKVLSNLNNQGYKNAVVVVGADQVKAFQYLKNYNGKPDKAGNIAFNFDTLNVISRQETSDPSRDQEGPRATPMRQVLQDPSKSEEEQFQVWRDAMSPEVSDDEVRDLMNKARQRMNAFAKPNKKGTAEGTVTETNRMSAAVKLQRAFQRQQEKSTASRKRGEEIMAQAKADAEKKRKEQSAAEAVDIGREWMSDTELDQYVPDHLHQQWRELLGYDRNGNPSALWANLTGGYEPDVNDRQHRALMVKVANKWFAAKKIPNVKFFSVRDADDELEWLVQIGEQGAAEASLKEFASGDGDREEDTLLKFARMWYTGNEAVQQKGEGVLSRMGG